MHIHNATVCVCVCCRRCEQAASPHLCMHLLFSRSRASIAQCVMVKWANKWFVFFVLFFFCCRSLLKIHRRSRISQFRCRFNLIELICAFSAWTQRCSRRRVACVRQPRSRKHAALISNNFVSQLIEIIDLCRFSWSFSYSLLILLMRLCAARLTNSMNVAEPHARCEHVGCRKIDSRCGIAFAIQSTRKFNEQFNDVWGCNC